MYSFFFFTLQCIIVIFTLTLMNIHFNNKLYLWYLFQLSTRCQDLIPRAILCCTKVAKQQEQGYLDTDSQETIINRAQELTNILKVPQ